MDYNPDCPAWGSLTWPKVGEFNLANGEFRGDPIDRYWLWIQSVVATL